MTIRNQHCFLLMSKPGLHKPKVTCTTSNPRTQRLVIIKPPIHKNLTPHKMPRVTPHQAPRHHPRPVPYRPSSQNHPKRSPLVGPLERHTLRHYLHRNPLRTLHRSVIHRFPEPDMGHCSVECSREPLLRVSEVDVDGRIVEAVVALGRLEGGAVVFFLAADKEADGSGVVALLAEESDVGAGFNGVDESRVDCAGRVDLPCACRELVIGLSEHDRRG